MSQKRNNSSSTINKHSDNVPQKENDHSPETKIKVTEYCNLTYREFKRAATKKLSELQENSEKHLKWIQ